MKRITDLLTKNGFVQLDHFNEFIDDEYTVIVERNPLNLLQKISKITGFSVEEIKSNRRHTPLIIIRQVFVRLAELYYPEVPANRIAAVINRTHTLPGWYKKDKVRNKIEKLKLYRELKEKLS